MDDVINTSHDLLLPHLSREPLRFKGLVSLVDLRRASIRILLSLLPLPLQFPSSQSEVSISQRSQWASSLASFLQLCVCECVMWGRGSSAPLMQQETSCH